MKKLRAINNLLFIFVVTACSSSSKVQQNNSKGNASSNSRSSKQNLSDSDSISKTTSSDSSSLQSELAEAIKKDKDGEIVRIAHRLLSMNPKNIYALNALAIVHYKKGEFTASQLLLERAIKENSKSSDLHNNMALIKLGLKDTREAIRFFRTALSLNPNDKNAAANVGAIYLQNKDYHEALTAMELVADSIKDSRFLMNYAVALVANKNYEKAERVYQSLIKNSPGEINIMFNYSILLIDHLGKNKEGLDLISKIKFLGPPSEMESKINMLEGKAKTVLK